MGDDKFTCPGCEDSTNAKSGRYCPECEAFVCEKCQRRILDDDGDRTGSFSCPVCGTGLV